MEIIPDGSTHEVNVSKREKCESYLVDFEVTGSYKGTADDPKFSLKILFQYKIFPDIAELVGHGGQYDGYTPVIQGDDTGPHEERNCIQFLKRNCEEKGWHWEPQET